MQALRGFEVTLDSRGGEMEDPDRLLLFFWEQRRSGRPLTGTRASAIKQGLGWDGARSFNVWLKLTGEGKLSDGASESDWPVVTPKGVQRLRSLDAIPADQSPAPAAAAAPPPSALDQPTNPRVDATALLQLVKNQGGSLIASDLFGELQLQLGWSNQRVEQAYRAVTHDGRLEVINASHAVVGLKQPGQADPELPPEWTGTLVPVKPVELTGGVDPVQTEVSQAEVDHATLAILELLSRDDVQARDRSQLIQRLVQLLSSPEEPITGSAIDQALNSLIFKDVVKLEGGFGNILLSHHRRPLVPPDENLEEADLAGSLDAGPIAAVADDTVDPDPGPGRNHRRRSPRGRSSTG